MTAYSTNTQTNNTGVTIAPISAITPAMPTGTPRPTAYTLTSHKGNYHRTLPTLDQAERIAQIFAFCGLDVCITPVMFGGVA